MLIRAFVLGRLIRSKYTEDPAHYKSPEDGPMFLTDKRVPGPNKRLADGKPLAAMNASFHLIQNGTKLLATTLKAKDVLKQMQKLQHVSTAQWQNNYLPLFSRYAEYVQQLPSHPSFKRSTDETLLDRGLYLAHIALSCPQHMSELWRFALTSALLLRDMVMSVTELEVTLFDQAHHVRQRWLPLEGSMIGQGVYYQYARINAFQPQTARQQVGPLVARVVLPDASFNWLASDSTVFSAWMSWLAGDRERGGVLPTVWPWIDERIQNQAIEEVEALKHQSEKTQQVDRRQEQKKALAKNGLFGAGEFDFALTDELGALFIAWLATQLKTKHLSVNQKTSVVHRLPNGGVFLQTKALYQAFFEKYAQYQGQQVQIEKYLVAKALLQKTDQGGILHHLTSKKDGAQAAVMSGLVINNPSVLFSTAMPAVNYDLRLTSALYAKFAVQNDASQGLTQAPASGKNTPVHQ
jgi:hypothetical protein